MKVFGLSKQERLNKKKEFELVYSAGQTVYSRNRKLKATFVVLNTETESGVRIAAGVFKKSGNAVWRNRVKRLIKESYRLNKQKLNAKCQENQKQVLVVFSLYSINKRKCSKPKLDTIIFDVVELIEQIIKAF